MLEVRQRLFHICSLSIHQCACYVAGMPRKDGVSCALLFIWPLACPFLGYKPLRLCHCFIQNKLNTVFKFVCRRASTAAVSSIDRHRMAVPGNGWKSVHSLRESHGLLKLIDGRVALTQDIRTFYFEVKRRRKL